MLKITVNCGAKGEHIVCLNVYHEFALMTCSSSQENLTSALLTSRPQWLGSRQI
jgi:hypothetical protein